MAKLRERGLRRTQQRMAILRAFVGRTDHPSVEALYQAVRPLFPNMALSTVYNTLNTLVGLGEAVEIAAPLPEARFDPNTGDHVHLICLGCGKIVDVPMQKVPCVLREVVGHTKGFRPVVHVHQVLGYCAQCQAGEPGER